MTSSDDLSLEEIEEDALEAGWPAQDVATIAAITEPESGGNPDAIQQGQPYATTGYGLTQITPGDSEPQVGTNDALLNPVTNLEAALAKFQAAGDSFSPWTTYQQGLEQPYLAQAEADLPAAEAAAGTGSGNGNGSNPLTSLGTDLKQWAWLGVACILVVFGLALLLGEDLVHLVGKAQSSGAFSSGESATAGVADVAGEAGA